MTDFWLGFLAAYALSVAVCGLIALARKQSVRDVLDGKEPPP